MISYQVHKENNDLKGHVKRLAPNVLLVLDNYGLAHDIAVENPNTQVIFRRYWGRDDVYKWMSPSQFVAQMNQLWQGEPNIWFYTSNEAGMSIEMMEWEMKLLSSPTGMKFVLANPATGSFPDSVALWAYADKYIRFLIEHKDRFMLGLHEYFDVTPTITMPQWTMRTTNYNGLTRPAYHCGRYRWLTGYCDQYLGGKYPRIVITETGNDDLTENRDGSDVNAFLANNIGFKPRGWQTLRQIWERWHNVQADIAYFNMFRWLVENVYNHPAIEGLCIFAWTSDDARDWGLFNVSTATNFKNLNEARATASEVFSPCVVTSANITNVRQSASTNIKIVARVTQRRLIEVGNKYGDWYRVRVDGVLGFVRSDVVAFSRGLSVQSTSGYNVLVRNAPSLDGTVLTKIKPRDKFYVLGSVGDWVVVSINGTMGYSYSSVLGYSELTP